MKQKDIKVEKLYTNGKIVRGVVRMYTCHATGVEYVEYVCSTMNFCNFKLLDRPLRSFARWAKMECEFELQIKEE